MLPDEYDRTADPESSRMTDSAYYLGVTAINDSGSTVADNQGMSFAVELPPTDQLIFVTSLRYNVSPTPSYPPVGNTFGSNLAANFHCTNMAYNAGLIPDWDFQKIHFRALLTQGLAGVIEMAGMADDEYYNIAGNLVAPDRATLMSGSFSAPILTEAGNVVTTNPGVWTGANPDGTASGNSCFNWSWNNGTGMQGNMAGTGTQWISAAPINCTTQARLYCVGDRPTAASSSSPEDSASLVNTVQDVPDVAHTTADIPNAPASQAQPVLPIFGGSPPIPGDFNSDRKTDAADYVVWRKTFGLTGPGLDADADGNEVVDDLDYDAWYAHFGEEIAVPGAFTITGPTGTLTEEEVTITWEASEGATSYQLVMSKHADLSFPVLNETLAANSRTVFLFNGTYYLGVTAINDSGSTVADNQGMSFAVELPPTDQLIFVTSLRYNVSPTPSYPPGGNTFGSVSAADFHCTFMAYDGGLIPDWDFQKIHFRALLTQASAGVIEMAGLADDEYYNTAGNLVAADRATLMAGSFSAPILTQNAAAVTTNPGVWTGANPDGTASANKCSNWSQNVGTGMAGNMAGSGTQWLSAAPINCTSQLRLYCVGDRPTAASSSSPEDSASLVNTVQDVPDVAHTTADIPNARASQARPVVPISGGSPPVPGDFNSDRKTDAADYVVWRKTFGFTGPGLDADADGNEVVDDLDYDAWYAHFGEEIAVPGAFTITGPTGVQTDEEIDITWATSDGATSYELVLSKQPDLSNPILAETLTANTKRVYLFGGAFYVGVTAVNESGSTVADNHGVNFSVELPPNDQLIFVTSLRYSVNEANSYPPVGTTFGSVLAASFHCTNTAYNAGLIPGWDFQRIHFRALLTLGTAGVIEMTGMADDEYYNTAGNLVAADRATLMAGSFSSPILNQIGATVTVATGVWTGANPDGTASANNCLNWSSNSGTGIAGNVGSTGTGWLSFGNLGCTTSARFYCVGDRPTAASSNAPEDSASLVNTVQDVPDVAHTAADIPNAPASQAQPVLPIFGGSTPVPGDFNSDRKTDAADYVVWRKTFGFTGPGLHADADANEVIDDLDYDAWYAHYGEEIVGPGAFTITGPTGVQTQEETTITWSASEGATSYQLVFSRQPDLSLPILEETLTTTSRSLYLHDGTYYVGVTAINESGSTVADNQGFSFELQLPPIDQLIFATSLRYFVSATAQFPPGASTFHGVTAADYHCTNLANSAGLLEEPWDFQTIYFRALITQGSFGIINRAGLVNDEYYNTAGNIVASDPQSLMAGSFTAPILTQGGSAVTSLPAVWTGANADGTASEGNQCSNWMNTSGVGTIGVVPGGGVTGNWLSTATINCTSQARFYCVGKRPNL
jgi:hypothetical protein